MPTTIKEFEAVFPALVDDLAKHARSTNIPEKAFDWFMKVCIAASHSQIVLLI